MVIRGRTTLKADVATGRSENGSWFVRTSRRGTGEGDPTIVPRGVLVLRLILVLSIVVLVLVLVSAPTGIDRVSSSPCARPASRAAFFASATARLWAIRRDTSAASSAARKWISSGVPLSVSSPRSLPASAGRSAGLAASTLSTPSSR